MIHPLVDYSVVDAEYNAELEANIFPDIEGIVLDDVQNTEAGEVAGEDEFKEQVNSSASTSLDSNDTSSTSTSDISSSSD